MLAGGELLARASAQSRESGVIAHFSNEESDSVFA